MQYWLLRCYCPDIADQIMLSKYSRVNYQYYGSPLRQTAFFSAVEKFDPTLAVVLGRARLGTKI